MGEARVSKATVFDSLAYSPIQETKTNENKQRRNSRLEKTAAANRREKVMRRISSQYACVVSPLLFLSVAIVVVVCGVAKEKIYLVWRAKKEEQTKAQTYPYFS